MSSVVPFGNSQLPAHLQSRINQKELTAELAGGVTSGFPVLSYRGKVWRLQKGGQETNYVDAAGDPIPSVELILLKAKPRPSKIFYAAAYAEGSNEAPTCWSADGIAPDAAVQTPVHSNCAACPNNVWGSRITEQGKKSRKCSDTRRMAVAFFNEVKAKGDASHVFLMRIPPASLNPLKDYGEKILGPKGIPYYAVVTKVGFDPSAAHPKLTFKALQFLTEDEFSVVEKLRDGPDVAHILAESVEFEAGTTERAQVASDAGGASASSATQTARAAPAASRMRPVDDEDVPAAVLATTEEDDDQGDVNSPVNIPPAVTLPVVTPPSPPAAARQPRKRKAPAQISTPVEVPPAATPQPAGTTDFDAMLSSILGN
jgi:hypothetical protein